MYTLICLIISVGGFSQSKDTVLNMVLSKPFFYNVIQGKEGKIYAGTSKGIFELDGTTLNPYDDRVGYIITSKLGVPDIDPAGIRYYKEKKYLHLLPYPEMSREEYHASNGNLFYICSGGRLYIYDLLTYGYSYPNHSFRTISKDMLGTYSGIYLRGIRMGKPISQYTDGYIRQYGDRAFICNYDITVLEKEAIEMGKLDSGSTFIHYNLPGQMFFNDIFQSPDSQYYYVATEKNLFRVNYSFTRDSVLFSHDAKDAPVGLITESEYNLFFFADKKLFSIDYLTGKIRFVLSTDMPILAGLYYEHQVYLVTAKGLHRFNSGQQLEKIADINGAHSIVQLSGSELVVSSDYGLYLVNLANRNVSAIIEGVEFNRRALHKEGGEIYAGSINGLYTIRANDIPVLIANNEMEQDYATKSNNTKLVLYVIIIALVVIGLISYIFRKKISEANKVIEVLRVPKEPVTRETIEGFILHNLSSASIKTITYKFNMNAPQIYAILKPDRPGSIIQALRLQTLKKMRGEGKSIEEISDATGLSISYLKRLKT